MKRQLDAGRASALALAEHGFNQPEQLEAFWAGYLSVLIMQHPDLAVALRTLSDHLTKEPGVISGNATAVL